MKKNTQELKSIIHEAMEEIEHGHDMNVLKQKIKDALIGKMKVPNDPVFKSHKTDENKFWLWFRNSSDSKTAVELLKSFAKVEGQDPQGWILFSIINQGIHEEAPVGWEGTVKAMKKHKEIDNPWALSHWMKNRGMKSRKENVETQPEGENKDFFISLTNFLNSLPKEDLSQLNAQVKSGVPFDKAIADFIQQKIKASKNKSPQITS